MVPSSPLRVLLPAARVDLHPRYSEPHIGESYFLIVPFTPSGEQLKGSIFRSEG